MAMQHDSTNSKNRPCVHINPELVERYVFDLAKFGQYGETGVWRIVYSPEWVGATACYENWCREAGLEVHRDAVGNIWGKLPGSEKGTSIVSGSHIDSQTPGGRYDGALGAIAALIAIKALREQFGTPRRSLEAAAFCEEEGSRFPTSNLWASRAITGHIKPQEVNEMIAHSGETMAEAMREVGLDPTLIHTAKRDDIDTFIELHIEQGPILEADDYPVGIVNAITGPRTYLVTITGKSDHAGAFPMDLRRDALAGFAEMASGLIGNALEMGRPAVTTIGRMAILPNFSAAVPREVQFTLDARHPDPEQRQILYAHHEKLMTEVAAKRGLEVNWHILTQKDPCLSDPSLVKLMENIAQKEGIKALTMASGAAHDTQQMVHIAKVAMIFIRSKDGRSHTVEEFSSLEDMVLGIRLLAETLYELAY